MDLEEEIKSREEGEIGSESREKGDLLPCSSLDTYKNFVVLDSVLSIMISHLKNHFTISFHGPQYFTSLYNMYHPNYKLIRNIDFY